LEGQRPRLTHFSTTGGAEIAFRQHSRELTTEQGHREHGVDNEVLQQMEVALKQVKVFVSA
jgi:hypothetical protein